MRKFNIIVEENSEDENIENLGCVWFAFSLYRKLNQTKGKIKQEFKLIN